MRGEAIIWILQQELEPVAHCESLAPVHGRNVATFEHDRALIRFLHPREEPRQCRLSAAGFAHQTKIVAAEHVETDAADGLHILMAEELVVVPLAVCLRNILDPQDRLFVIAGVAGVANGLVTGPDARRAGHEFARYLVLGTVGDLHGFALFDDPATGEHQGLVRHLGDGRHRGADEDDTGRYPSAQFAQQPNDLRRNRHIERLDYVVADQQFRLGNERVDDDGALQHSAGILVRKFGIAALRRGDADRVEQFDDAFLRLGIADAGANRSQLLRDLVADGQRRVKGVSGIGADETDLRTYLALDPQVAQIATAIEHLAAGNVQRLAHPADHRLGQRGHARTAFTQNAQDAVAGDVDVDAVEDPAAVTAANELDRKASQRQQRLTH